MSSLTWPVYPFISKAHQIDLSHPPVIPSFFLLFPPLLENCNSKIEWGLRSSWQNCSPAVSFLCKDLKKKTSEGRK